MSARKGPGFRPAGQIRSRMPYRERDCEVVNCVFRVSGLSARVARAASVDL